MGIISGYICLVGLLIILARFLTARLKNKKLNIFFSNIHKPVSIILIIMVAAHLIMVFPVLQTRSFPVNASGFLALGVFFLLLALCHFQKDGKRKKLWHRVLAAIMLLLAVLHVLFYFQDLSDYTSKINKIHIREPELSDVSDGKYIGEYDAGYIYAKVRVTVKYSKIEKIELLEHKNERGEKAEKLPEKMVKEQRIDVEAVSGATNSSKVIKKACENALKHV